jgi:hypothetical protein
MAGLTFTNADSALKEFYIGPIREELNNTLLLLGMIENNTTDIEGRRAVLSLHVARNSGVGARAEGGPLPTAGNQAYVQEQVKLRYNYARITLTGPVMRAMKSDKGSFTRAVESETKGATNDLKRDFNRQLWGTSDGVIAKTAVTTASTTLNLNAATTVTQMRQLEPGMSIDAGASTPFTGDTGFPVTITSVNVAAKTVVVSGAVTTASGDSIVRVGSGGSGAAQKELTGLQTIIAASGALFNVDPAVNPIWASTVNSGGGTLRSVSESLFAQVMQAIAISSGNDIDTVIGSDGVFRAYANLLTALKRFPSTTDLKGGFKALDMSAGGYGGGQDVKLCWDRDAPSNQAFFLNTKPESLSLYSMSDWEWMQEDGAVLFRVSGQDAYEATLFAYKELATSARNRNGLCSDLTEA